MRARYLNLGLALAALMLALSSADATGENIDEEARRIGFEAADTDGDGRLDEAEIAADTAAAFSALDADGDYRLDQDEVGAIGPARFQAIDDDGDGKLTFNEVMNDKL